MGALTPQTTTAILLAAGESRRFGGDKLLARFGGATVLERSAANLRQSGAARFLAVIPAGCEARRRIVEALDYEAVCSDGGPMSHSLRLGVAAARHGGANAVVIALADVPLAPAPHYRALIECAASHDDQLAYTTLAGARTPPAVFGAQWFDVLEALEGDTGARSILEAAPASAGVAGAREHFIDIDSPGDLARAVSAQPS